MEQRTPAITEAECREKYHSFYENEAIAKLGKQKAWTISSSDKMPVSQSALLNFGELVGASTRRPSDMLTLDELVELWPDASNNAFYLRDDGTFAIVDIEPKASPELKAKLLALPWRYAEISMSGHGLHLVIDYPHDLLMEYPNARKTTVKAKDGTYEVHLQHWITFTRNVVEKPADWGTMTVEKALGPLFKEQRPAIVTTRAASVAIEREDMGTEPLESECMKGLSEEWQKYASTSAVGICNYKTPRKGEDRSRWDFGLAAKIARTFIAFCEESEEYETMPSFDDVVEATYRTFCYAAVHLSMWRQKNDMLRGGMTYLEMTCQRAVDVVMTELENRTADDEYANNETNMGLDEDLDETAGIDYDEQAQLANDDKDTTCQ